MKKIYTRFVEVLFQTISLPEKIRDFFMWPIATRILGKDYMTTFTLKAGFKLNSFMDDQLGRLALFYGRKEKYFWEPTTTRLLEKLVPGTKNIVVAGAHIGMTVLFARKAMGKSGIIHTFEPNSHLYHIAKDNFKINKFEDLIILNKFALGNSQEKVIMTNDRIRSRIILDGKNPKHLATEEVTTTTLDTYKEEKEINGFELFFLDIEGFEYNAFLGAEELLKTKPPRDIIYEISFPYKDNLEMAHKIENYLGQFCYTFYIINDDYNPVGYQKETPPIELIGANDETYALHKSLRYFNMYATLRSKKEVALLIHSED